MVPVHPDTEAGRPGGLGRGDELDDIVGVGGQFPLSTSAVGGELVVARTWNTETDVVGGGGGGKDSSQARGKGW